MTILLSLGVSRLFESFIPTCSDGCVPCFSLDTVNSTIDCLVCYCGYTLYISIHICNGKHPRISFTLPVFASFWKNYLPMSVIFIISRCIR